MLIYQDIFSNDELASDSFPMKLVDDLIYEFTGKYVQRKEGDIVLAGSNPSAEDGDEAGGDEHVETGIDIVLNHKLQNMSAVYSDKKAFTSWAKEYMKKLVDHMKKEGKSDEEMTTFKSKVQAYIGSLIKADRFKTLDFFAGEGENASEGQLGILEYRDVDGEEKPILMLIKQGVEEIKC